MLLGLAGKVNSKDTGTETTQGFLGIAPPGISKIKGRDNFLHHQERALQEASTKERNAYIGTYPYSGMLSRYKRQNDRCTNYMDKPPKHVQ